MNFDLTPELQALKERTRRFIAEEIIPFERDPRNTDHGPSAELRDELLARARAAGLLSPHVSEAFGGLGLSHIEKAVIFEEAGYSTLGPVAMNIFAPDEGNMHLMEVVATEPQKERWLRPLAQGLTRSCFCMTEPSPGAGSDPGMLKTEAVRDGEHFVINGVKWFITGADGAAFAIIMARMEDGSATCFSAIWMRRGYAWSAPWNRWTAAFRAAIASCALKTCACRPMRCWASWGRACGMRRCVWRRRA